MPPRFMGMNPCNIEQIFRKPHQLVGVRSQAVGVVAIEEACGDPSGSRRRKIIRCPASRSVRRRVVIETAVP